MRGIDGFMNGMGAFSRALSFLRAHRGIVPLMLLPFLLNLVLYVGLIGLSYLWFSGWLDSVEPDKDAWYWRWFLRYFVWLIYATVAVVIAFFTFVPIGTIVTAPFAELISAKVEAIVLPDSPKPAGGVAGFLADIWLGVSHAIVRVVILGLLFLLILPILFIPIVGQAALAYVSIRYLAWDGLDYALARRRMSFSAKSAFMRANRARTVGLGAAAFLLFLVPFTALFVLPMLAVSGTLLFCEIEKRSATANEDGR